MNTTKTANTRTAKRRSYAQTMLLSRRSSCDPLHMDVCYCLLAPKPGGERFPPARSAIVPNHASTGNGAAAGTGTFAGNKEDKLSAVAGVGRLALLKAALGARRCSRLPQAPASLGQSAGWAALADQVGDLRSDKRGRLRGWKGHEDVPLLVPQRHEERLPAVGQPELDDTQLVPQAGRRLAVAALQRVARHTDVEVVYVVVLDAQREEFEERVDLKEGGAIEGGGVAVPRHGVLRLQPVDRVDDVAVLVHVLPVEGLRVRVRAKPQLAPQDTGNGLRPPLPCGRCRGTCNLQPASHGG
eukprot:scaffold77090_cov67-Phaeocystis_antarctica.AAC.6